ncbi:hypothetical protein AMK68_00145 [candidate division KD3-62 bacterium DG_56]|uniref:Uncharacterized protein n=1 Tax=candidate division KD3-62 bacterium DG_56 TaxID=1704032 RepID=A0A0S7XRJ1_9BACT|nr:MAG: hypothetical protein AMK68_00145 [candidate division KD3-62 bacterium DG_56]
MAGKLIYIGDGAWLPGAPAADHDEPDEEAFRAKIASGLYRSESGREIREREAAARKAKEAANAKAGRIAKSEAAEARSDAESARAAAEAAEERARSAEARAAAMNRRGRK